MKCLTNQQKKFVTEYIKTLNGELSAKTAGYKQPTEIVDKLLNNSLIVKEINTKLKEQINALHIDKGYVIKKLLQIAEFSLEEEDILDKDGGYTGKKKLRDTTAGLKALESLCKYLGFSSDFKDDYQPVKIITISNLDEKKI